MVVLAVSGRELYILNVTWYQWFGSYDLLSRDFWLKKSSMNLLSYFFR